jgi:hypothetical protein
MAKKSTLKRLGTAYEPVVSVPSKVDSVTLCNASENLCDIELAVVRGQSRYSLYRDSIPAGRNLVLFRGAGVNLEGTDVLEARSSLPDSVDLSCSYGETSGSGSLFNIDSWNDRSGWYSDRGTTPASFNPPQFVLDGLNAGAARWRNSAAYRQDAYESVTGLLPGWRGLELENYTEINADNGYLASCGVNLYIEDGSLLNAVSFNLQVNLFYAPELTQQEWNDIMTHEMGHGLGIGIFWTASSFFLNGTSYPNTQTAYNGITSLERAKTPLETSGGSGTASAHWEDDYRTSDGTGYYGVVDELMVGALVPGGMVLSDLSLGALKDFGYEVYPGKEGVPSLATSTMARMNDRVLKCGLSSQNPDRMMRMLKPSPVATDGKFTLRRYIMA